MQNQVDKPRHSPKDIIIFVLMGCTAILITVAGVLGKQNFLRIMPLYISIIIGMLQSKVNRYACLLGSVNSLFYTAVYFYFNLYGSAFSALLFSFPIQLITFIRWNKNKRGSSTELHQMSWRNRIFTLIGFCVALVAMWIVLPLIGSQYVFLDSVTNLLGILIYFLTMFAYVEYTSLMIINGVIGIALYVTMLKDNPEITTYLIYSVYSLICIIFAFFEARKLYKMQQAAK